MSEYFSESTIDRPPREPKESNQTNLPGVEESERLSQEFIEENGPYNKIKYQLTLALKSEAGDTILKFGPFECFPEQLEDHVEKQFNSKYFRNRIKSALALDNE